MYTGNFLNFLIESFILTGLFVCLFDLVRFHTKKNDHKNEIVNGKFYF